ncbi:MAG: AAA family ATPase [Muribaculaceae bacterium]|nr:AAA family ATPase [Muribaculaceae bacterium]
MKKDIENIDLENEEFQNAWKLIRYTHSSVFLTGKAGTGKSTFLRYICANTKKNYVVLAPTGIAAVNVGGQTMHSFFRIPFKPLLPDDPDFAVSRLRQRLKYPKPLCKLIKKLDLIIIDEISMVRADIIDFMDKVLRVYSNNMREPFGGKQLLLVGDIFQLEPVVTADMRDVLRKYYPNSYFFNALAFREFSLVPIELRKIYRQKDSNFISLLDRVRVGQPTANDIAILNTRVGISSENNSSKMVMQLATRRDIVDSVNEQQLDQLPSKEIIYEGIIKGEFPEKSLPTSLELVIKVGAQVVFLKNDIDKRWVNGTIGKVHKATKNRIEIELENGTHHEVEPEIWRNIVYEYDEETHRVIEKEIGSFTQYPLKLAWALTIHKSQGLTFNNVIIDFGQGAFSSGQSYVALSRCTSIDGLVLKSNLNYRDVFVNPSILQYSQEFNNPQLINSAMQWAKADDAYQQAAEEFDKGNYRKAVDEFIEAINSRNELSRPSVSRLISRKLSVISSLKKEVEECHKTIEAHKQRFRELAREYVMMGNDCLHESNDYTPAIANFNKAISLCADFVPAWYGKGLVLMENFEHDEAISAFKKVVELDELNFNAPFQLGNIYMGQGDFYEALNWYLVALSNGEKEPSIHMRLSDLYEKIGDDEQADMHSKLAKKYRNSRKK